MKKNEICNFDCKISCSDKCCIGETMIGFDELFDLKDKFIFNLSFFVLDNNKNTFVKSNYQELNGFKFYNNKLTIFAINSTNSDFCDMLDNKTKECKLHNTNIKPIFCKLMPFDPIYKEKEQFIIIQHKKKVLMKDCEGFLSLTEKNYTKHKNGKYINKDDAKLHLSYRNQIKKLNNFVKKNKEIIYKEFIEIVNKEAYTNINEGHYSFPITYTLYKDIFNYYKMSNEKIRNFINSQITLINNTIDNDTQWKKRRKEVQKEILLELKEKIK